MNESEKMKCYYHKSIRLPEGWAGSFCRAFHFNTFSSPFSTFNYQLSTLKTGSGFLVFKKKGSETPNPFNFKTKLI